MKNEAAFRFVELRARDWGGLPSPSVDRLLTRLLLHALLRALEHLLHLALGLVKVALCLEALVARRCPCNRLRLALGLVELLVHFRLFPVEQRSNNNTSGLPCRVGDEIAHPTRRRECHHWRSTNRPRLRGLEQGLSLIHISEPTRPY